MLETDAAEMGRSHPRRATAASRASSTLMLISPAILSIALFLLLPVLCVFLISLTDYRLGLGRPTFVGFDNYVALTDDAQFGRSLTNTFVYVAIVTPVTVLLGLVLAIAIESRLRLRRFWRTVFFIPIASTLVAIAVAWEFIFDPSIGLINQLLTALGFERINFLGDPATALFVLAIIGIWDQLAVNVTLFVAGLAMVPRDYYDAAAL
ncbi:MAG: sugar ABC transporter permease, partial [Pseudomonadota bacterium]